MTIPVTIHEDYGGSGSTSETDSFYRFHRITRDDTGETIKTTSWFWTSRLWRWRHRDRYAPVTFNTQTRFADVGRMGR